MNAYELADELDKYKGIATRDAATMLRQQQAEIEALKLQLHTTLTNRNIEKPAVEDIMEKYCTCYKLGYSPLNNYASVKAK
jgi:hypothetical protein